MGRSLHDRQTTKLAQWSKRERGGSRKGNQKARGSKLAALTEKKIPPATRHSDLNEGGLGGGTNIVVITEGEQLRFEKMNLTKSKKSKRNPQKDMSRGGDHDVGQAAMPGDKEPA